VTSSSECMRDLFSSYTQPGHTLYHTYISHVSINIRSINRQYPGPRNASYKNSKKYARGFYTVLNAGAHENPRLKVVLLNTTPFK